MLNDSLSRFRGRPAAMCAALGAVCAMACGGAMAADAAVASAATNVAQFQMVNDANSTTAAQAARYQIVQLQYSPTVQTLVDQIHADDPGVKVLMYSDTAYPASGQAGTDGWTTCTTTAQETAGGPSWRLYDGSNQLGFMNAGNTGFQAACASHAIALAKSADFDGIFWDNVSPYAGYLVSNTCINADQAAACSIYNNGGNDGSGNAAWEANEYSLVRALGAATSRAGLMSIINDGSGTTSQWAQWNSAPGISGSMEESFGGSYLGTSVPYSQWQTELANEIWSEANGKYEMAVHYDPNQNQESQDTYGLSSMLLAANGHTSYDSTVATLNDASYDWWPEYTSAQTLGAPSGSYTTVTSGGATVYERRFANGIVVVNPTSSTSASVPLGATYNGTGNEPPSVTNVTLPPQSGLILTTPESSASGSGSGSAGSPPTTISLPKQGSLPKLSCKTTVDHKKVSLTCTTEGGSKGATSLRLRAYHANRLIANHAAMVRHHRATFGVKLSKHRIGKYRFVVSIEADGKVRDLSWTLRIRR